MEKRFKYCRVKSWQTSRLKGVKLAIVGCGDVGQRLVEHIADKVRVRALGRTAISQPHTRFISINLDERTNKGLRRAARLAQWVVYLAPPANTGADDARIKHFLARAHTIKRCIYVSTTAVYGAANGAWVSETSPLMPIQERGKRRLAAENRLKRSVISSVSILRAPGIYTQTRLPIERIQKGLPALRLADDVPSNHIHADDLARLCWLGLFYGRNRRAYNAADGQPMMHGEYLSAVASTFDLQTPPRLPREQVKAALTATSWSMLSGARRVSSERLLKEWGVTLKHFSMKVFLKQLSEGNT